MLNAIRIYTHNKGVFQWLGLKEKDSLHRLFPGQYLKLLFELHERSETLDISKESVVQLCGDYSNGKTCKE
ncbi:MAG: hypothetical protein KAW14_05835 [Candidatus Aegiribacteria sp.]|nr:hypothetical protein [Candidatus Aegiribacteria sp.]